MAGRLWKIVDRTAAGDVGAIAHGASNSEQCSRLTGFQLMPPETVHEPCAEEQIAADAKSTLIVAG